MTRLKTYTKNRLLLFLLIVFISGIATNSCEKVKTYEEGPGFSLRSKKNRITGTWEVVSFEVNNYNEITEDSLELMELTLTKDEIENNLYRAEFINYKIGGGCVYHPFYFSGKGTWTWNFEEADLPDSGCNPDETIKKKEGIYLTIKNLPQNSYKATLLWKILKLRNNELILYRTFCTSDCNAAGWSPIKINFKKK